MKDWIKNLMADTIQFCGDSFCADTDEISWTTILAKKLGAIIIGKGRRGTAHETVFKTFKTNATYTVICWTDANRVHVPTRDHAALPGATRRFHPLSSSYKKSEGKFLTAALGYYKYLHSIDYVKQRQQRELYWFDQTVLSKSNSKIVHLFCFNKTYTFDNGYTHDKPIKSMYNSLEPDKNVTYSNHLSPEDNDNLARQVYTYLELTHD